MSQKRGPCLHNINTAAEVRVIFCEDSGRYMAEVEVRCQDCGTRFAFLGMPMGLDFESPRCSVGRLVALLPLEPDPHVTSMLAGEAPRPEGP